MKDDLTISLVVPCFNEEANIQKGVLDKIGNFTALDRRFKEVLIVDDGSNDGSQDIIKKKYLAEFPKFKLIENPHQGKAFAVIKGIKQSKGAYVLFTDIDLATPIEEDDKLIEYCKNYEIVIGSRTQKRAGAPLLRKIMARGAIVVRNIIIGLQGIHDTQCGFKLFERKAALNIIDHLVVFHDARSLTSSSVSAAFDMEFLFVAQKKGYKIKEVPVSWKHVETKNVNFLKDSVEGFRDIIKIKFNDILGKYEKDS